MTYQHATDIVKTGSQCKEKSRNAFSEIKINTFEKLKCRFLYCGSYPIEIISHFHKSQIVFCNCQQYKTASLPFIMKDLLVIFLFISKEPKDLKQALPSKDDESKSEEPPAKRPRGECFRFSLVFKSHYIKVGSTFLPLKSLYCQNLAMVNFF